MVFMGNGRSSLYDIIFWLVYFKNVSRQRERGINKMAKMLRIVGCYSCPSCHSNRHHAPVCMSLSRYIERKNFVDGIYKFCPLPEYGVNPAASLAQQAVILIEAGEVTTALKFIKQIIEPGI